MRDEIWLVLVVLAAVILGIPLIQAWGRSRRPW